jgi:hypothetical protein
MSFCCREVGNNEMSQEELHRVFDKYGKKNSSEPREEKRVENPPKP